ncbi:MAG TPA: GtrA family protein [Burkholderiaceae bacterium]|nr:GtrA family protein [Burkholderiaceae bacterium]
MLDTFFRFIVSLAVGALVYVLVAIAALSALRATSELDPTALVKLVLQGAGLAVGALVAYVVARGWAFRSRRPHAQSFPRFVVVAVLGVLAHEAAFYSLLSFMPWPYTVALASTLSATTLLGFIIAKRWVFSA